MALPPILMRDGVTEWTVERWLEVAEQMMVLTAVNAPHLLPLAEALPCEHPWHRAILLYLEAERWNLEPEFMQSVLGREIARYTFNMVGADPLTTMQAINTTEMVWRRRRMLADSTRFARSMRHIATPTSKARKLFSV